MSKKVEQFSFKNAVLFNHNAITYNFCLFRDQPYKTSLLIQTIYSIRSKKSVFPLTCQKKKKNYSWKKNNIIKARC